MDRTTASKRSAGLSRVQHPQITSISLPTTSSILNRKPVCSCGGSCPKCQSKQTIQTKLKIGAPNDKYEQEADRVADQVMRMPEPKLQRQDMPEEEAEEIEEPIQAKPLASSINPLVQRQATDEDLVQRKHNRNAVPKMSPSTSYDIQSLQSGGQALSRSARGFLEPRIGADFSNVRVHTDTRAVRAAQSVHARAFTLGHNVVFAAGEYSPDTYKGRHLLAHELTHVIQQSTAPGDSHSLQTANKPEEEANGYEKEDTIFYIGLALQAAADAMDNEALSPDRRSRIQTEAGLLSQALVQLHQSREADGSDVLIGFNLDPREHEIVPGDAGKSNSQLFSGIEPGSRAQHQASASASDEGLIQTKSKANYLNITPMFDQRIQRICDPLICVGIIIIAGLLFAGCSRSSSRPCPKGRIKTIPVDVFELQGRSLTPKTEMDGANRIWSDVAGIAFDITYHPAFDEERTRAMIGLEAGDADVPVNKLELDYSPIITATDEMKQLRALRRGNITVIFVPRVGYIAESAIDPSPKVKIAYIGESSRECPGAGRAVAHEIGHLLLSSGHKKWDSPLLRPSKGCRSSLTELECRMARGESSAWAEYVRKGGEL